MANSAQDLKNAFKLMKKREEAQILKFQQKYEADTEILEAFRDFAAKKSEIDSTYAKSLQKLCHTFQVRKFKKVLSSATDAVINVTIDLANTGAKDGSENVKKEEGLPATETIDPYVAFSTILDQTAKYSESHGDFAENVSKNIAAVVRNVAKIRATEIKQVTQFLKKYHEEFDHQFLELEKAKLVYDKVSKEFYNAKGAHDKFLTSGKAAQIKKGEKNDKARKLQAKMDSCSNNLDEARNMYVLAIKSVNILQNVYYCDHIPKLMERMDNLHPINLKSLLMLYNEQEIEVLKSHEASVSLENEIITSIDREKLLDKFYKDYYNIYSPPKPWTLINSFKDQGEDIIVRENTLSSLGRCLTKLYNADAEHVKNLDSYERGLADKKASDKAPKDSSAEKYVGTQKDLIMTKRAELEAQILALEDLGVNPVKVTKMDSPKQPNGANIYVGCRAAARFSYVAEDLGKISVREGEVFTVLALDQNGWTHVKLASGNVGDVPTVIVKAYIPKKQLSPVKSMEFSESSTVVPIMSNGLAIVQSTPFVNTASANHPLSPTQASPTSGNGLSSVLQTSQSTTPGSTKQETVRALFVYQATCEGELGMEVGDTIVITSKFTGSDAWWEGKSIRGQGQFPVNYVESISPGGSDAGSSVNRPSTGSPSSIMPGSIQNSDFVSPGLPLYKAKALFDYTASNDDELNFTMGEELEVLDATDPDWYEARISGKRGMVPANYLEKVI